MGIDLTIGVCSYRAPEKLKRTIESLYLTTQQRFRLRVWHNVSDGDEDAAAQRILESFLDDDVRVMKSPNVGYAGALNGMLRACDTPYFAYCDNDIEIRTPGWDREMMQLLATYPEVAQVFPGRGHYGFKGPNYHECLWNAGYFWMVRKAALATLAERDLNYGHVERIEDVGTMDTALGHHEEVDLMIRLRLAGFQIACIPGVDVLHHETATQSDSALHKPGGRIHDGVVRWMNKWNRYFCGDQLKYSMTEYDPGALRYTDWPPCALYMERLTLANFPRWNQDNLRAVDMPGSGFMDAVEVLKPSGPYRGRAI